MPREGKEHTKRQVLDMPTLLQRGLSAGVPTGERHWAWRLGVDDVEGDKGKGGWGAIGSVTTDGVSLCVSMWRRQREQELARLPNPREPGPVEQWEAANRVAYLDDDRYLVLGADTGLRNTLCIVIPTVSRLLLGVVGESGPLCWPRSKDRTDESRS
jgi:hypothetical protein